MELDCNQIKDDFCNFYKTTITLNEIENALKEIIQGEEPIDLLIRCMGNKERALKFQKEIDNAIIRQLKDDKYKKD